MDIRVDFEVDVFLGEIFFNLFYSCKFVYSFICDNVDLFGFYVFEVYVDFFCYIWVEVD